MLPPERHRHILQLVAARGSVRTVDLARSLQVTEETVRRDIQRLDIDGQLTRTHGGALRTEANRRDLPLISRATMNAAEKQAIARAALDNIQPGDTVLLDASSTTLELARQLPDIAVTVLTNALKVAVELAGRPAMHVALLGGTVSPGSLSCVGALSDRALECYNVQKAFISCRGVDPARGLSESNEEQARLKRRIVALADRTFLLADDTKLGLKSAFFFAGLAQIDVLITNRIPDPELARELTRAGVQLQVASDISS